VDDQTKAAVAALDAAVTWAKDRSFEYTEHQRSEDIMLVLSALDAAEARATTAERERAIETVCDELTQIDADGFLPDEPEWVKLRTAIALLRRK
jgi:hypothetical protein